MSTSGERARRIWGGGERKKGKERPRKGRRRRRWEGAERENLDKDFLRIWVVSGREDRRDEIAVDAALINVDALENL